VCRKQVVNQKTNVCDFVAAIEGILFDCEALSFVYLRYFACDFVLLVIQQVVGAGVSTHGSKVKVQELRVYIRVVRDEDVAFGSDFANSTGYFVRVRVVEC